MLTNDEVHGTYRLSVIATPAIPTRDHAAKKNSKYQSSTDARNLQERITTNAYDLNLLPDQATTYL